jgi:surface protein
VDLFNWDTTFLTDSDTPDEEEELTPTARHATAENMFRDCSSLTSVTFRTFKTNRVVSFSSMFRGCSSLTSLELPDGMNTGLAFGFAQMFYGCSSLESLTLPAKFNTNNGMAMNDMFGGCDALKLVTINSDISPFKGRANGWVNPEWDPSFDAYSSLPTPPTNDDYTGKWILSDALTASQSFAIM